MLAPTFKSAKRCSDVVYVTGGRLTDDNSQTLRIKSTNHIRRSGKRVNDGKTSLSYSYTFLQFLADVNEEKKSKSMIHQTPPIIKVKQHITPSNLPTDLKEKGAKQPLKKIKTLCK